MAKVSIPLLGAATGLLSGVEFYRSRGVNFVRGAKLKQYKKKTSAQIAREQLFRQLVLAYSAVNVTFSFLRKPRNFRMSFANFFLSRNYKHYSYNPSLNNIRGINIPSFRFFPYTKQLNLFVSEYEYEIPYGFVASYASNFDASNYEVYGIAVSLGGRIFEPCFPFIDSDLKTITIDSFYPICNGLSAYIFLFFVSWSGDSASVIFESYTNMAIPPK